MPKHGVTNTSLTMLEEVYDPVDGFIGFAIWNGKEVKIADSYEHLGVLYRPRVDDGVKKNIILLPSKATSYGRLEDLLASIKQFIRKYLDVKPEFLEFAAWYVLLTWVYDRIGTIVYLRAMGDWGTGKSRFLDVIGGLCYRTMNSSGATSAAAVSRLIELWGGTLILNEADWEKSDERQEIVRILNEGIEKRRAVIKAHQDKQKELIYYSCYGPKILSTRKAFEDPALESRCITEVMEETLREDIPPILTKTYLNEVLELRNKLLMFRFNYWEKVDELVVDEIAAKLAGKLEKRLIQTTISFAVLFAHDQLLLDRFISFLLKYQDDLREQWAGTYEGQIINAIYELVLDGQDTISAGDISLKMQQAQGWDKPPHSVTIGRHLHAMGIKTQNTRTKAVEGKDKVVRAIIWDKLQLQKVIRLIKKYVPGECSIKQLVAVVAKGIDVTTILETFGLGEVAPLPAVPSITDATTVSLLQTGLSATVATPQDATAAIPATPPNWVFVRARVPIKEFPVLPLDESTLTTVGPHEAGDSFFLPPTDAERFVRKGYVEIIKKEAP